MALAFALLPYYGIGPLRAAGVPLPGQGPYQVITISWIVAGLVLGYVLLVERLPLASLLLRRPSGRDLSLATYLAGAVIVWSWLATMMLPADWQVDADEGSTTASIASAGVAAVLGLLITVAVCEELLFRGFVAERLAGLIRRFAADVPHPRWIAAGLVFVVFAASHLPGFGPQWLLIHGPGALAISVYYAWRANLPACIWLHLLINSPILIPTVLGQADR